MVGSTGYLIAVLFGAIVLLIILINWRTKLHPFLALFIVSFVTALAAGEKVRDIPDTLVSGMGGVLGETGIVVFLGAMLGRLLADSGAVGKIAELITEHSSPRAAPWITTAVAFLLGIPMFFEVGLVVLMPVIYAVALRLEVYSGRPRTWYLRILIPAIAALSCLHGMVPPHPGPVIAVTGLNADMGLTIGLGLICAIPAVLLSGPVYAKLVAPRIKLEPPEDLIRQFTGTTTEAAMGAHAAGRDPLTSSGGTAAEQADAKRSMPTGLAFVCILVPVVLMLLNAVVKLVAPGTVLETITEVLGDPVIAMAVGVLFTAVAVAYTTKADGNQITGSLKKSLSSVASVVLIIAGGGAFNEVLKDSGIGDAIVEITSSWDMNLILLGWLIGLLLSFSTGSATVGIVSATGILAPLVGGLSPADLSLVVIGIGSGSIGLNWVNHAGFWFVKESFGMSLGQATKTHMVVQTLVSVFGLIFALLLSLLF